MGAESIAHPVLPLRVLAVNADTQRVRVERLGMAEASDGSPERGICCWSLLAGVARSNLCIRSSVASGHAAKNSQQKWCTHDGK